MTENTLHPADANVLAEYGNAELIDLILPDMNGLLRGKRITRDALEKVYQNGVCLPMSLIGTDVTGNTVEETGLGYDIGDEDRICRPVPGTLRFHVCPDQTSLLTVRASLPRRGSCGPYSGDTCIHRPWPDA